ncbi:DUF4307 domain-containing protein [Actinacidiphila oryziradicis]|uniref:DUF4307 domain-containing protein n=1 Tax=Actinacidiphila oryziradicis TaxID=2571141 RepID=A0A4V5MZP9_9ACTN|nr:DUF4307 domain-containing protein [Actinacidiphila oryziradicis]TKA03209.1 DUF4307 domain-containing protein [Actinacidiphila oryziradicis]
MTALREELPKGRYGHSADARADRRLRQVAVVCGVALAVLVGWLGWHYLAGAQVSGQLVTFKVVSDQAVEVHLEVNKPAGTAGVCTLRALDVNQNEVGRRDVPVAEHRGQVDTVVTVRTTSRATAAELVSCKQA